MPFHYYKYNYGRRDQSSLIEFFSVLIAFDLISSSVIVKVCVSVAATAVCVCVIN